MAVLAPIIRWIRGDFRSGTGLLQEPRIFKVQASDLSMQGIQASRHQDIYIRGVAISHLRLLLRVQRVDRDMT
jgi:hypothetical protein